MRRVAPSVIAREQLQALLVLQRQFAVMVVGDRGGGSGRFGPGVVGVAASWTR